jgi:hypothetical protein
VVVARLRAEVAQEQQRLLSCSPPKYEYRAVNQQILYDAPIPYRTPSLSMPPSITSAGASLALSIGTKPHNAMNCPFDLPIL